MKFTVSNITHCFTALNGLELLKIQLVQEKNHVHLLYHTLILVFIRKYGQNYLWITGLKYLWQIFLFYQVHCADIISYGWPQGLAPVWKTHQLCWWDYGECNEPLLNVIKLKKSWKLMIQTHILCHTLLMELLCQWHICKYHKEHTHLNQTKAARWDSRYFMIGVTRCHLSLLGEGCSHIWYQGDASWHLHKNWKDISLCWCVRHNVNETCKWSSAGITKLQLKSSSFGLSLNFCFTYFLGFLCTPHSGSLLTCLLTSLANLTK